MEITIDGYKLKYCIGEQKMEQYIERLYSWTDVVTIIYIDTVVET